MKLRADLLGDISRMMNHDLHSTFTLLVAAILKSLLLRSGLTDAVGGFSKLRVKFNSLWHHLVCLASDLGHDPAAQHVRTA